MTEIESLQKKLDDAEKQGKFLYALSTLLMIRLGEDVEFSESEWHDYTQYKLSTEILHDKNTFKVTLHRRP